ncbi:MAG TPA: hypothetical protein VG709_03130 [Actinomycetota bacterium]|nr:hypothetical protein [Actinomycetota bacterium]
MSGWWAVSYVVLWVLVVVLGILVVALAREVGTLHLRRGPRGALELDEEGPPLGEAPEPIDALDSEGRHVTVGGPGGWQLLVFVSPGCPVCREVLPSIEPVARVEKLRAVVVSDERDVPVVGGAAVVPAPDIAERYATPGTPYVVLLDAMGVVRAKGTVNNLEQIEGLVRTAKKRLEIELAGGGA